MKFSPIPRLALPDCLPEPLLDLVLRHGELSLGAKALVVYVLLQDPGRLIARAEFERLGGASRVELDAYLHELVATHWLMAVPAGERPCSAYAFLVREENDVEV